MNESKAQSGGEEIPEGFRDTMHKEWLKLPHRYDWLNYLEGAQDAYRHLSTHPPVIEGGLRWVGLDVRFPDDWESKYIRPKGRSYEALRNERFEHKNNCLISVDGFYTYDQLEWLEELAPTPTQVTDPNILSIIKWAADNHVRKEGGYWRKDFSSIAYTDETIVKAFLNPEYPIEKAPEGEPSTGMGWEDGDKSQPPKDEDVPLLINLGDVDSYGVGHWDGEMFKDECTGFRHWPAKIKWLYDPVESPKLPTPVPAKADLKCCSDCAHLQVDNSPDQTGPSIWCGKGHFDGIGSQEECDDLSKHTDCPDFLRQQSYRSPVLPEVKEGETPDPAILKLLEGNPTIEDYQWASKAILEYYRSKLSSANARIQSLESELAKYKNNG